MKSSIAARLSIFFPNNAQWFYHNLWAPKKGPLRLQKNPCFLPLSRGPFPHAAFVPHGEHPAHCRPAIKNSYLKVAIHPALCVYLGGTPAGRAFQGAAFLGEGHGTGLAFTYDQIPAAFAQWRRGRSKPGSSAWKRRARLRGRSCKEDAEEAGTEAKKGGALWARAPARPAFRDGGNRLPQAGAYFAGKSVGPSRPGGRLPPVTASGGAARAGIRGKSWRSLPFASELGGRRFQCRAPVLPGAGFPSQIRFSFSASYGRAGVLPVRPHAFGDLRYFRARFTRSAS